MAGSGTSANILDGIKCQRTTCTNTKYLIRCDKCQAYTCPDCLYEQPNDKCVYCSSVLSVITWFGTFDSSDKNIITEKYINKIYGKIVQRCSDIINTGHTYPVIWAQKRFVINLSDESLNVLNRENLFTVVCLCRLLINTQLLSTVHTHIVTYHSTVGSTSGRDYPICSTIYYSLLFQPVLSDECMIVRDTRQIISSIKDVNVIMHLLTE